MARKVLAGCRQLELRLPTRETDACTYAEGPQLNSSDKGPLQRGRSLVRLYGRGRRGSSTLSLRVLIISRPAATIYESEDDEQREVPDDDHHAAHRVWRNRHPRRSASWDVRCRVDRGSPAPSPED